jgi:periplasmic protein TonB
MGRSERAKWFIALLGATTLHLVALLTVRYAPPRPLLPAAALEIVLVAERQPAPPLAVAPTVLAAQTQLGTAPVAASPPAVAEPTPSPIPAPAPSKPAPVITQPAPSPTPPAAPTPPPLAVVQAEATKPLPEPDPLSRPAVTAAQILASQGAEIAQFSRAVDTRALAQAQQVRRHSISASTREFRYANYLSAWARKVERIGNLNYPPAAKAHNLSGSLIVHVALRADGSVETIRVVRSSGVPLLDQAALAIVTLAAPYAPFPPDIAADTDVLDIIRTWQFKRGGTLGWERSP